MAEDISYWDCDGEAPGACDAEYEVPDTYVGSLDLMSGEALIEVPGGKDESTCEKGIVDVLTAFA